MTVLGATIGFLFALPLFWFFPQLIYGTVSFRIAGWPIELNRGLAILYLLYVIGMVLSVLRRIFIVRLSFNVVYQMKQLGQRLVLVFSLLLSIYIVVSVIARQFGATLAEGWIFSVVLEGFLAAVVVNYYGDLFNSKELAVLCFRQAIELKSPVSKGKWIESALKHLREYASEYGLQLDTSEFKRLLALRLLQGKKVDSDLKNVSKSLLKDISPITVLSNMKSDQEGYPFVTTGKTRIQRLGSYLEKADKYASLLGAIGTILVALVTFLMLRQ